MRRFLFSLGVVAFVAGFAGIPEASAQQQSVNFFLGGFVPRNFDERATDDVLFQNDFLDFNMEDFNGATVGAEWLVGLGDWFDAGIGVGIYRRTTPTVYSDFVNSDGSEIEQDLKLRIAPVTATIRFLPLGHRHLVRPYVGAGVGIFFWRYGESGQFVDFDNRNTIFRGAFKGRGATTGPVVLGGLTFPIGRVDIGGEVRWQQAEGTLPEPEGFAGSTIDLGGMNYLFVVNFRF